MISIICCSRSAAHAEVAAKHWHKVFRGERFQMVNVLNPRSMALGYVQGMQAARGDILVFAHDDVEPLSDDFVPKLKSHMAKHDVVGVAGTSRLIGTSWVSAGAPDLFGQVLYCFDGRWTLYVYGAPAPVVGGIQALDGLLLAFRRDVVEEIGWDFQTFTDFHFYDLDSTYRAHLAGYRLAVANDLPVFHASSGKYGTAWQRESQRFLGKFNGKLPLFAPKATTPITVIRFPTKEAAIAAMTPAAWETPPAPSS